MERGGGHETGQDRTDSDEVNSKDQMSTVDFFTN